MIASLVGWGAGESGKQNRFSGLAPACIIGYGINQSGRARSRHLPYAVQVFPPQRKRRGSREAGDQEDESPVSGRLIRWRSLKRWSARLAMCEPARKEKENVLCRWREAS